MVPVVAQGSVVVDDYLPVDDEEVGTSREVGASGSPEE